MAKRIPFRNKKKINNVFSLRNFLIYSVYIIETYRNYIFFQLSEDDTYTNFDTVSQEGWVNSRSRYYFHSVVKNNFNVKLV